MQNVMPRPSEPGDVGLRQVFQQRLRQHKLCHLGGSLLRRGCRQADGGHPPSRYVISPIEVLRYRALGGRCSPAGDEIKDYSSRTSAGRGEF